MKTGRLVDYLDGEMLCEAYVAVPPQQGPRPCVPLIHDVSATSAKPSGEKSSITHRMRNRRPHTRLSKTKSSDHRWFGPSASTIDLRVPSARSRPPRRRTRNPSSRVLPVISPLVSQRVWRIARSLHPKRGANRCHGPHIPRKRSRRQSSSRSSLDGLCECHRDMLGASSGAPTRAASVTELPYTVRPRITILLEKLSGRRCFDADMA